MAAMAGPSRGSPSDLAPWLTGVLGRYRCRLAETTPDLHAARRLRQDAFGLKQLDDDGHDARFAHLLVEDPATRALVGTCRIALRPACDIDQGYAACFYDLDALLSYGAATLEVSRFVVARQSADPQVARLIWAALARLVAGQGVGLLFGCSSFRGVRPDTVAPALAYLATHHQAPPHWRPRRKAPDVIDLPHAQTDSARALRQMPPLLRSYLSMGGWVSDHAVVDRAMDTLHVFTGVEVAQIPRKRADALAALAAAFEPG